MDVAVSVGSFCATSIVLYWISDAIDEYKQKQKQVLLVLDEKQPIDFEKVKSFPGKKNLQVALKNISFQKRLFQKSIQEIPKVFSQRVKNLIFENACGNNFDLKYQNRDILVKITNCNILYDLVFERQDSTQLFPNIPKNATHCDMTYYIPPLCPVTMIGTLSYGIIDDRFVFKPNFILNSFFEQKRIAEYFSFKKTPFIVAGSIFLIGAIYFGYSALQKIKVYTKALFQEKINPQMLGPEEQLSDIDFFKTKVVFSAQASSKLNCINCAFKISNIAFDCGHITLCEDCLKPEQNVCSICHKRPRRWMKIFI